MLWADTRVRATGSRSTAGVNRFIPQARPWQVTRGAQLPPVCTLRTATKPHCPMGGTNAGGSWKSSFHPPRAPRQLKLLQHVALGAWDAAPWLEPWSGRCRVPLLPSRWGQAGQAPSIGGGVTPCTTRFCSIAPTPCPPLDLCLLSSPISHGDMKGWKSPLSLPGSIAPQECLLFPQVNFPLRGMCPGVRPGAT